MNKLLKFKVQRVLSGLGASQDELIDVLIAIIEDLNKQKRDTK